MIRLSLAISCLALSLYGAAPVYGQNSRLPSAASYYDQGRLFIREEDWYAAAESLLECLRLNPAHAEGSASLAECYYALGEFDQALAWTRKARSLARGNLALANLEAFSLIALGRLTEAASVITGVLASEPYNKEALFAAAELDIARGRHGDAVTRYRDAARRYPDDRRLLVSLALVLGSLGEADSARSYIERAIARHPQDYRVYYYAAYLDAKAGRLDTAVKHAESALFFRPGYAPAFSLLASLRYRTGAFEEALGLADKAIGLNRHDISAWYLKGMALIGMGRKADALAVLSTAASIDPHDEFVRAALEDVLFTETNLEDSRRSRWARWHFERGRDYHRRNLIEQSLFEYRRGLRLNPYAPDRREYAELLRIQGYPARYLEELRFMQALGLGDRDTGDALEAYDALLDEALYRRWGVNTAEAAKPHWNIAVFSLASQSSFYHADAGAAASRYIKDILVHERNINPMDTALSQPSFSHAFRQAREAGADYFLIISVSENERDLLVKGELFVGRTGTLAASFSAYRTGTDRLRNAARGIADRLNGSMPFRGELLQYKQGQGLIDKGRADGVENGAAYHVVKRGQALILHEGIGLAYSAGDIVGKLVIDTVDEEVASGAVTRNGFFDRITPGDEIILEPEQGGVPAPEPLADPELRALLRPLRQP
ncbi:MAG: tetratricopeptide repeat protein [Spirochaetaceae bacterium]|jgi:tetratricopeptide (TPR) repeat protein|nr:tetratricopeptide repeat protein [Spirochaetaceae bacterium]